MNKSHCICPDVDVFSAVMITSLAEHAPAEASGSQGEAVRTDQPGRQMKREKTQCKEERREMTTAD